MSLSNVKIFSGKANKEFAQGICDELGVPLGKLTSNTFRDGEINLVIDETVRGKDLFLIQPTCNPVNDNLMELLIMIDAALRASAGTINAVIPYYGYARQDRKTRGREPITAKLVANLLTTAGADRVVTMDLHAGQIQGYFDIPLDHLTSIQTLAGHFKSIVGKEDYVIVSPDLGGVNRARQFANYLHLPIAIIEKRRPKPNESEIMNIIGDIEGKHAIIIDDIIDTGGTICNAAKVLVEKGAGEVHITATHGVFSGDAIDRIENSVVKSCVVTDTIPLKNESKLSKIHSVSAVPAFAQAIERIYLGESVSELFNVQD